MAKTLKFRKIITEYLNSVAADWSGVTDTELQVICDTKNDHYLLLWNGWSEAGHTHSVSVHLDIKSEKIWIQENLTELEIGDDLMARGVAKSDIVLGVIPPEYRKYSDFAVA
jgi:XisI protein